MPELSDLKAQSEQIAGITNKLRAALLDKQTIRFFNERPELSNQLQSQAVGLKSQRIVLWGLREAIEAKGVVVDTLPAQSLLQQSRSNNWLQAGDKIAGWISYLADLPRVIDEAVVDGYRWHWDGDTGSVRGPGIGYDNLDKWFQSYGWVKFTGSTTQELFDEQAAEITSLQSLLTYFQQKQYLD